MRTILHYTAPSTGRQAWANFNRCSSSQVYEYRKHLLANFMLKICYFRNQIRWYLATIWILTLAILTKLKKTNPAPLFPPKMTAHNICIRSMRDHTQGTARSSVSMSAVTRRLPRGTASSHTCGYTQGRNHTNVPSRTVTRPSRHLGICRNMSARTQVCWLVFSCNHLSKQRPNKI